MRIKRRDLIGGSIAAGLVTSETSSALAQSASQDADALAYFREAKIDWKQAAGQSLTMGLNKHPFTESLLPLIPQFKSLTGINVDYLILPEDEYFTKLAADLSQQRGEFSVIMTAPTRSWQYVMADWILPLDPLLSDPKLTDPSWYKVDDFYPALVSANRWNGQVGSGLGEGSLYAIPVLEESYILAYRKDLFDQYKIKVPTTLDEMAEAARAIKKNAGIPGIVARGTPGVATVTTGFLSGLEAYSDGKFRDFTDKLAPNLADPVAVKFTETWVDMIRESGPSNWANMLWYDAMQAFAAGQAGMIADCDFFAATYEDPKKSKVAGKVGYALLTGGTGGKSYANLSTWSLAINKATKSKTAAWLFIAWATSQRALLNATLGYSNYNPARASIANDPRVQSTLGAWGGGSYIKTVAKNLETARVLWTPEPERTRVGDTWARALQAIYFKQSSAADALKRASDDISRVFDDAGLKP